MASFSGNGALSGGMTGASVGSAFGPVGAVIGGVGGGILGGFLGGKEEDEEEAAQKKYQNQLKQQYQQGLITLQEYQNALASNSADYLSALQSADWDAVSKIDFDKDSYNRDDYRKSNENTIKQGASNTAMAQNIGNGSSWGSGAQANILSAVVKQQEDLDEYADTQMNKDMEFDYKLASDSATNRINALKSKLDSLKGYTDTQNSITDSYYGGLLSLQNTNNANANNYGMAQLTNNANSNASTMNNLMSLAGTLGKAYAQSGSSSPYNS